MPWRKKISVGSLVWLISMILGITAGGCGRRGFPELEQVSGRVTRAGQPVRDAMVTFTPESGKSSTGITDTDGHYELVYLRDILGAIPGQHEVTIQAATEQGAPIFRDCLSPETPRIRKVVRGSPNRFDFELGRTMREKHPRRHAR